MTANFMSGYKLCMKCFPFYLIGNKRLKGTIAALIILALTTYFSFRPTSAKDDEIEVRMSYSCPRPPHIGMREIDSTGKVTWIIFQGLHSPPKSKSSRQKKQLKPEDMRALKAIIAKSNFKTMPEHVRSFPPRQTQTDPCNGTIEIVENNIRKSIHYLDGDIPEELVQLVHDISVILDRYPWEQDVSP